MQAWENLETSRPDLGIWLYLRRRRFLKCIINAVNAVAPQMQVPRDMHSQRPGLLKCSKDAVRTWHFG